MSWCSCDRCLRFEYWALYGFVWPHRNHTLFFKWKSHIVWVQKWIITVSHNFLTKHQNKTAWQLTRIQLRRMPLNVWRRNRSIKSGLECPIDPPFSAPRLPPTRTDRRKSHLSSRVQPAANHVYACWIYCEAGICIYSSEKAIQMP